MNRREFLTWLGVGAATAAVAPSILLEAPAKQTASAFMGGYTKLGFTGFKASMTQTGLAGQFLWVTGWEASDGTLGKTHWMQVVTLDLEDIVKSKPLSTAQLIQCQLENGLQGVIALVDGIVADAAKGQVQTGRFKQVANPEFNPELPETFAWSDPEDYEVWNPKFLTTDEPIMQDVKRVWFEPYDSSMPEWNMQREVLTAMQLFGFEMKAVAIPAGHYKRGQEFKL